MPLHLLGKKSWHVYNSANVERVKRDEAEAKAKEEAEEQRLQLEDAAIRTAALRGERLVLVRRSPSPKPSSKGPRAEGRPAKRRRLHGEDDTDRDIRWAREDAEVGDQVRLKLSRREHADDRPLHDADGHIQLVPMPEKSSNKAEQNRDAQTEVDQRKQREEDRYAMRFSNAAGSGNGVSAPWYANIAKVPRTGHAEPVTHPSKDVWGNEDPRRRDRAQKRLVSSDPLAFMQQAQRQLKQSERDREKWKVDQAAQVRELKHEQRQTRPRNRRLATIGTTDSTNAEIGTGSEGARGVPSRVDDLE